MSRAIWSRLVREDGHFVFVSAVLVQGLLMVMLGMGFVVERVLWNRAQADMALTLAAQAACRAIQVPVGPAGPVIDGTLSSQVFKATLTQNLPGRLGQSTWQRFSVVQKGTFDPATGYVFAAPGVRASMGFQETILGVTIPLELFVDAEVHDGTS